jgi:two-component system sensor histidine kinase/response regulator
MNTSNPVQIKILVADDDVVNQQMMEVVLGARGHVVEFASNGLEALNAIQETRFDIVFMDLQMPFMDGVESSRKIREWEKNSGYSTYIVALTASFMPERGQELFEAGIDNYIAKPFNVDQIYRMVGYCISASLESSRHNSATPSGSEFKSEMLDVQEGLQRLGGDVDMYASLLAGFIRELPDRLDALERSLQSGDLHALSLTAHNLKGVSANLGALVLSGYAKKLESHIESGYTASLAPLVAELIQSGIQLEKASQVYLSNIRSEPDD